MSLTLKYIVVGNGGVGKSCLLLRYTENKFEPMHDLTIGVEFGTKTINMGNYTTRLQIWDTAGQEAFKSIISSYFRGAVGGLLVFDITKRDSFEAIRGWMNMVKEKSHTPITLLLVGNKYDLQESRTVTKEEAQEFAQKNNMVYIETSTKTGHNVNEVFTKLTSSIIEKIKVGLINPEYYRTLGTFRLDSDIEKAKNDKSCYCG
jgi:Ras-related protein Rab-2A